MKIQRVKMLKSWLPKTRKSNPWSKLLRPVFEEKKLVRNLMVQLLVVTMVAKMLVPSSHAFDDLTVQGETLDASGAVEQVTTEPSYHYPVASPRGISQGYHGLHRAIDIRAPRGSAVMAMAEGVVVEVRKNKYGYGKHVRIAHRGTMASLYAHLDEIKVSVGERVEKGEVIGTVGLSGWTTGPHLHFEVSVGKQNINPEGII